MTNWNIKCLIVKATSMLIEPKLAGKIVWLVYV